MKKTFLSIMLASQILTAAPEFKNDDNLLTSTLPSGMTIAVYKNAEPPNRVSMRLLVKRGSAYEDESELGLAHFLEHMAFNGTTNFPAGEMVEYFQRLGMAFGADTNAHTGFIETVYKLDMPEVSPKLVGDGLTLLRDYADGMLLTPEAIEKERGVIIAEKDSRDTQDYRKAVKEIAHFFKGSVFADRMPIGSADIIKNAQRETFEKFYRANYRPENTVLVIVGDVNAQSIMAEAEKAFADFKPDESEPARNADFGRLESADFKFSFDGKTMPFDSIFDSTPNAARSYASVAVAKQTDQSPDSLEKRVDEFRMRALTNAITARYLRVADLPDSQITQGSAGVFDFGNFCRVLIFNSDAPVTKSSEALEENFRQILSMRNLDEGELDNAKKKIYENIESDIKGKSTRKNQQLANEITSAFSGGELFTSPEDDLEVAKYALENFGAQDAKDMLKAFFDNASVKVFLSDSTAEPSKEALEGAVQNLYAAALSKIYPAELFAAAPLQFSKFDGTGQALSKSEISELGITQVLFENGVRLNVKTTDFAKDEIMMKISFGRGLFDIPMHSPEYFVATYALLAGGTKFQNFSEINAAQYLLKMNIGAGVEGNSFHISGQSTRKDFDSLVRLASTFVNDPGFREDGAESLAKYAEGFYLDYRTDPAAKLRFLPLRLINGGIPKVPGSFENFKKITMADIGAWMTPILKNSYMEISIVGDISVEEAEKLIAETFGAMAPRLSEKEDAFAKISLLDFGSDIKTSYETTDEPRSVSARLWLSFGRQSPEKMRAANVLGAILDDVLRKEAREKEGKVYSPFAYNNSSTWMKDVGFLSAFTFVVPQYNDEMGGVFEKCAQAVSENISEDEFERAKIPLLKSVEANKRRNVYWLDAVLNLSQAQPVNIELAKSIDTAYAGVSLADVSACAKEIFARPPYVISIMPGEIESK